MNKTSFLYVFFLLSGGIGNINAQSLKELFLKMPQQVCPCLSEYNRLELVDNQKNDKPMQTRNMLQNYSKMTELTDDYAHLIVSANSEETFKLMPTDKGNSIIMVISTVMCDSINDSSVSFYTCAWEPLQANDYFAEPVSPDFRRMTIDNATNTLKVTTYTPLTLQTDGSDKPVIIPPTESTFKWTGSRFEPI